MKSYIELLNLESHIEGGYFGVFYKSQDKVAIFNKRYADNLKEGAENFQIERSAGSSIYFLLDKHDFSAWHQLKSDEIWHYYDGGSPLDIHVIDSQGKLNTYTLGNPLLTKNASFQVVIKAGDWFAAEVRDKSSFALAGCTVSPGFEYQDFILANRELLAIQFPEHANIINRFTRVEPVEDGSAKALEINL